MIALIDCNSFYASCEKIFRPDLNNKPVIVLSNNDGCAIARTQEAKNLGIKMGAPYFQIKDFCHKNHVAVFSSNFSLYTDISHRVMNTLREFSPLIEVYSVDEAFLDLSGISNLDHLAHFIKNKVMNDIGIPVGVGIGKTKVLSKAANFIAKKVSQTGVCILESEEEINWALQQMPIGELWGVGRKNEVKMKLLGIRTAYDLKTYSNDKLILRTFTKLGLMIKQELSGIQCFDLNLEIEKKKEIMCSRTFGGSVWDKKPLRESIANYASSACERLRAQRSLCSKIAVFCRTNPHKDTAQFYLYEEKKLATPTQDTRKVIQVCFELLDKSYRYGYEYKKAGVRLSGLFDAQSFQLSLLEKGDTERDIKLMNTLDKINAFEGDLTIKSLACGLNNEAWRMNRAFKSPRYTTSFNELFVFKC